MIWEVGKCLFRNESYRDRDFDHMSEVAARSCQEGHHSDAEKKEGICPGPGHGEFAHRESTGILREAANAGEFDSSRIRSFNLDEYVGLPGQSAQQRVMHPESYCYFMIQEFFGLLAASSSRPTCPAALDRSKEAPGRTQGTP
jgi:glucosamine-6-phosphate deaminase